jgi:hypothetical protein
MYENRPQIKSFLSSTLPNDYHLELYTTEEGLLDSEYDVDRST